MDQNEHQTFGSNGGTVMMPYYWALATHPPAAYEVRRTKKVHLIIQLLSGTRCPDGYSVYCPPKGREIFISHQSPRVKKFFWGPKILQMVPKGVARNSYQYEVAEHTVNFTNIPNQVQRIEFPFAIDSLIKKQPFMIKIHHGASGVFLGLYIIAKLNWTDEIATGCEDYVELAFSAEDEGRWYDNEETGRHNNPSANNYRATCTGRFNAAASTRDAPSEEDIQLRLLRRLFATRANLRTEDLVDVSFNDSGVASTIPQPPATANRTPKRTGASNVVRPRSSFSATTHSKVQTSAGHSSKVAAATSPG